MPVHLSVATAIEKNRIESDTPILLLAELNITNPNTRQVDETLYIVRNNEPVSFNGNTYQPANFNINVSKRSGEQTEVEVSMSDPTGFVSSRMEAYAGAVFSTVKLMTVNAARLDKPAEIEETFQVLTSSVKGYDVSMRLGLDNFLSIAFPKHKQFRNRCRWRFKGYGCRYAGADATCSYTYDGPNGCLAKGNQANFGGLRGLVPMNL